jgi:acetyl esterase/lipase
MSQLLFLQNIARSFPRVAASRLRRGPARPSWSFRFELFARAMRGTFGAICTRSMVEQRAAFEAMANTRSPALGKVKREPIEAGGVPCEWFTPRTDVDSSVILFLHGGGYVFGSTRTHGALIARIALAARSRVLAPNYRLAPEHPFPAAVDDAVAVYEHLLAEGIAANRIVVSGDSAGGGLTMSLLLRLRDTKRPLPAGAALICPWVDHTAAEGSVVDNEPYDYGTRDIAHMWRDAYLAGVERDDPRVSPVFADLKGLPPMLVQVGGAELLCDQASALARRANEHGVDARLHVEPDMIHDWHSFADFFSHCHKPIDDIGKFVREVTRSRPS